MISGTKMLIISEKYDNEYIYNLAKELMIIVEICIILKYKIVNIRC